MHVRILKSTIICTLNVLASVSCLSMGTWQNRKHPINRLQTRLKEGIGLISPIQLPFGLRFLSRPRNGNYNLEAHGNFRNKDWTNYKNNIYEKPIDTRINVVTPHYEITHPIQNEYINEKIYFDITDESNSIHETTEITENTKQMKETTTETTEPTVDFTTETYSTTIDIDLTTVEDLARIGVNPSVVASVLG